ncbi:MAG: WG repeat-containing protein [Muribaculaceae bacterium]|nr:WG repeat-containing protein [Muribaculaceae bacterium]
MDETKTHKRGWLRKLAELVGLAGGSKWVRCARRIVAVAVLVGTIGWAVNTVEVVVDYYRYVGRMTFDHKVSPAVVVRENFHYNSRKVVNTLTGRTTIKRLDWMAKSVDGDSLVLFSDGKYRGYFDLTTGEPIIAAKWEHAWIFSEGIAAVERGGKVCFIGHNGQKVMEPEFAFSGMLDGYCFHNGRCVMDGADGRVGLIDRQGRWVLKPQYDELTALHGGKFWQVNHCDRYGLLDDSLHLVLPCVYRDLWLDDEARVVVTRDDWTMALLDLNGHVVNEFVFTHIEPLNYTVLNDQGEPVNHFTGRYVYSTALGHYGLTDGLRALTPPIYSDFSALNADVILGTNSGGALERISHKALAAER